MKKHKPSSELLRLSAKRIISEKRESLLLGNQKGFTVVEILLALLVVAVVGFGGYYVWHTQHKNSTTSNSTPAKSASTSATTPNSTPTQSTQQYLTIQEWGVKAPLSSDAQDLYYVQNNSYVKILDFRTKTLDNAFPNCTTNSVIMERGLANEEYITGEPANTTFKEAYDAGSSQRVRVKIGDYYYLQGYPGAVCSSRSGGDIQENQIIQNIKDALSKLQSS